MALVAFASAKASPGVTTTLAALAATWPEGRELTVAELDPSGGDLIVRFDLALEPGLVSLAAAGRRELGPHVVIDHSQVLPGTDATPAGGARRLLGGPVAADQAYAALQAVRGRLGPALAAMRPGDVVADLGRLDPGSPSLDVLSHADLVVMVTRPVLSEVHHLRARVAALGLPSVSVLVIGESPYRAEEVGRVVGAHPLGALPFDPRAASALAGAHPDGLRALRRSRLLRSARVLAEGLVGWLSPPPPVLVRS